MSLGRQYAALGWLCSEQAVGDSALADGCGGIWFVSTSSTSAAALIMPAPAPTDPPTANVLVTCSACVPRRQRPRIQHQARAAHEARRHAVPTLHHRVRPAPGTPRGYVFDRYESIDSADRMWLPGAARSGFTIKS